MTQQKKQDWSKVRNCHCYSELCKTCTQFVTERKGSVYSTECKLNRYSKGIILDFFSKFKTEH